MKLEFFIGLVLSLGVLSTGRSQQTIGLFTNDSLSQNGYTLFSANRSVYLIDNCGFLVREWTTNYRAGLSCYLLENGNLLRPGRIPGEFQGLEPVEEYRNLTGMEISCGNSISQTQHTTSTMILNHYQMAMCSSLPGNGKALKKQ